MTDRECFIRRVCEQPDEDSHRLVFADWLDEQPKPDCPYCKGKGGSVCPFWEHGELWDKCVSCNGTGFDQTDARKAAFIRSSIADGRRHYRALGDVGVGLRSGLDAYLEDSTAVALDPLTPGLVWHRGFVCEVRMFTSEFFRLVKVLFRSYPIRRVVLTDAGLVSPYDGSPRVYVNNVPALNHEYSVANRRPTYFPVGMKNLLKMGSVLPDYGDRRYDTEREARDDLSQACVAFGRLLVGFDGGTLWTHPEAVERVS